MYEPNRVIALSYRLGYVCLASLLLLPVAIIIILVLIYIYDSHDSPPGYEFVFGVAAAAVVFPGLVGMFLAIPGSILMYAQGSGGRNTTRAALRGVLTSSPAPLVLWWYVASVCWI